MGLRVYRSAWAVRVVASVSLGACAGPAVTDEDTDGFGARRALIVGDRGLLADLPAADAPFVGEVRPTLELFDITCRGPDLAWVVGAGGTMVATLDGGAHWGQSTLPTDQTLTGVDAAVYDTVYAAGHGGALAYSDDDGWSWRSVPSPARDWSSVAVDRAGRTAFVTGLDGSIWCHQGTGLTPLFQGEPGDVLLDVDVSPDARRIVAVGELGMLVESLDGGASWVRRATRTSQDLHAVQLQDDGTVVAVGDGGTVVLVDGGAVLSTAWLGPNESLRGVHLDDEGFGHAVGTGGWVLQTEDGGLTWDALHIGVARDLWAVDHLPDDRF